MTPPAHRSLLLLLFTAAEDQDAFDRMIEACAAPLLKGLTGSLDCRVARASTGPLGHPPYEWVITLRFPNRTGLDSAISSTTFAQFEALCGPWLGLLTLVVADEQ